MANLARMLVLGPGPKKSPSSPPSAAIQVRSAAFFPPPAPAGRPRLAARNGFRFLRWHGQHGGCKWCGTVLSIPADGAVTLTLLFELLVAVLQVDEVDRFSGREIVAFRGASGPEMERQVACTQQF